MNNDTNVVKAAPYISKNAGITIVHWNARSPFHKLEEIMHIIESTDCELFCLSETWLTRDIPDTMLDIPGYQLV